MNIEPFQTLIKERDAKCRWYPQSVLTYKSSFKLDANIENVEALKSNLAYNMQYIEFLEKEIQELKLSDVIYTMLVKTYVITGMSILEGLFTNIIKSNGWWKTSTLESLGTTQSNETNFTGSKYIIKTELLKKVDKYNLQMNLDELIKILSRHHEALDVDHLVYPALKRLRMLRNRIHLHNVDNNSDHDYNAFDYKIKKEMGSILHEILSSPVITNTPKVFDFLRINRT